MALQSLAMAPPAPRGSSGMELDVQGNRSVEAFYALCSERPEGITNEDLHAAGWTDRNQILNCVNILSGQQRLSLIPLGQGRLAYQVIDAAKAARFRGLDAHSMAVYQLIEKAGDRGAWSKNLKDRSGLQQHTVAKVTKELLRRQLIKEVKSVQNRGRKVFMLWEVEPAVEVSGGSFYHDGEFASKWIESLRERCQQYLESNHGRAVTLQDVHCFVVQQPTGASVPTEEDVAAILRTLELDEEAKSIQTPTGQRIYTHLGHGGRAFDIFAGRQPSFVTQAEPVGGVVVPCFSCHLRDECRPGARICPEDCTYLDAWLKPPRTADDPMEPVDDW